MKILILDNYDSFTYNLVHIIEKIIHQKVSVFRNDEISLEEVNEYDKIVLSPGPGLPSEAGIMIDLIKRYGAMKSILGVCLGHQAIGEAYGGKLLNLSTVYHGIATPIHWETNKSTQPAIQDSLPPICEVGRYHSWVVDHHQFPSDVLDITARDENGFIMALQHKKFAVVGVQFHPESVLTPLGETMLNNWLKT